MAKKENNNQDINEAIKKQKKKMMTIGIVVILVLAAVGGFFGLQLMNQSKEAKAALEKELESVELKDYPVDESEKAKIYTRDITKQTYILKNGAILFEGTIIFHNKLCANLYNGIVDRKEQAATEPALTGDTMFGDKLVKDSLNRYFQGTDKNTLRSTEKIAGGVKDAINKEFKETFGQEVVAKILVTSHIVQ